MKTSNVGAPLGDVGQKRQQMVSPDARRYKRNPTIGETNSLEFSAEYEY
jgi:hypothetical protein